MISTYLLLLIQLENPKEIHPLQVDVPEIHERIALTEAGDLVKGNQKLSLFGQSETCYNFSVSLAYASSLTDPIVFFRTRNSGVQVDTSKMKVLSRAPGPLLFRAGKHIGSISESAQYWTISINSRPVSKIKRNSKSQLASVSLDGKTWQLISTSPFKTEIVRLNHQFRFKERIRISSDINNIEIMELGNGRSLVSDYDLVPGITEYYVVRKSGKKLITEKQDYRVWSQPRGFSVSQVGTKFRVRANIGKSLYDLQYRPQRATVDFTSKGTNYFIVERN